jgi:hypothetical protein
MPLPPDGDANDGAEPRLDFSHVECLIYSYHKLARQCPEALTKDAEKLKDFRLRCVWCVFFTVVFPLLANHF